MSALCFSTAAYLMMTLLTLIVHAWQHNQKVAGVSANLVQRRGMMTEHAVPPSVQQKVYRCSLSGCAFPNKGKDTRRFGYEDRRALSRTTLIAWKAAQGSSIPLPASLAANVERRMSPVSAGVPVVGW